MKEVLVSFKEVHHYGSIHAIYIMSLEDWKKIKYLQNEDVSINLGEMAGKHSEVYTSPYNFMLVSKDPEEIETFRSLFGNTFGSYKPFDYAMELYEELNEEEDED